MPQAASWTGSPSIKGKTEAIRMALLTFSLIGLQFTWGIEMTWCTPYLLKLGLSKSKTSLVWIAGPLSGLIMQPIVGAIADNSRSRFGRRRPYMIGGSIVVVFFLGTLGWAKEIVQIFTSESHSQWWTIALAVGSIYAVDFAINAVQSSCRSLIVDTLPIPKQQTGSAWATRMIAVGHLVGYGVGTVDLPGFWGGWLGDTQLKQLIVIASVALLGAVGLTSWAVKERVLVSSRENTASGLVQHTSKIIYTTMHLPRRIQAICWIQFWAWIGWFPFLFYGATWVGETYFSYSYIPTPNTSQTADDRLSEIGRIGSLSLLVFSLVTLAGSILLPLIVSAPDDRSKGFTPRPPPALASLLNFVNSVQPDLLHTWFVAHIIFAGAMGLAPLVQSVQFATVLVAICGIPWALAAWAPFSFMGVEINRLSAPSTMTASGSTYRRLSSASLDDLDPLQEPSPSLRLHHLDRDLDEAPTGELAGIYLGILNLYTTLPQFVGTFISMVVFAIFEPGKSKVFDEGAPATGDGAAEAMLERLMRRQDGNKGEGVNAIGICLFIGAISSLGAAYATLRLKYVK